MLLVLVAIIGVAIGIGIGRIWGEDHAGYWESEDKLRAELFAKELGKLSRIIHRQRLTIREQREALTHINGGLDAIRAQKKAAWMSRNTH